MPESLFSGNLITGSLPKLTVGGGGGGGLSFCQTELKSLKENLKKIMAIKRKAPIFKRRLVQ